MLSRSLLRPRVGLRVASQVGGGNLSHSRFAVGSLHVAQPQLLSISVRCLSTSPPGGKDEEAHHDVIEVEPKPPLLDRLKLWAPTVALCSGGALVAYGISKMVLFVTGTMMSVTFTQVGTVGFAAGIITSALCGAGAYGVHRWLTIRPEPTFRRALKMIAKNKQVLEHLGKPLKPGNLRAYTLRRGHYGLSKTKFLKWRKPRVQMLFQVQGKKAEGMVSLEAVKNHGSLEFTLLTVDALDRHRDDFFLIEGDEDRLKVRGQLRGFLQTERVKFLEQSKPDEYADGHMD